MSIFTTGISKMRPSWVLGMAVGMWALPATPVRGATDTLVPLGVVWKYLDDGSNQGLSWVSPGFNDAAWSSGQAQLGYGDGDEVTAVSYGPDPDFKYVTTYFRRSFQVTNASAITELTLSVLRDDGVVVYLNGTEVFRNNMPSGPINYLTLASTNSRGADETRLFSANLNPSLFVTGANVVAAEIHQATYDSVDISFDLRLRGLDTFPVSRGPYLQKGTPNSLVVRWRTSVATDSRVNYGTIPNNLNSIVSDALLTSEHELNLTGLLPDTKYYYSIGSTTAAFAGDESYFFVTAPATAKPTRVWVIGDSGTAYGTPNAAAVRDAYSNFTGGRHTDLWLMLGDNAYSTGTDLQYQQAVFSMYSRLLRQSVLWPTLGNHDALTSSFPGPYPYFDIFNSPTQGEAGGLASGTERYYSFEYGNIHFVCLDSMSSSRATNGPMLTWLREDLAANTKDWLIAYWHHPPYSKGSHNSDDPFGFDFQLVEMRTNALPILESYGVDLVLAGHSHCYERSFLLDGHYGYSTSLTGAMIKDAGSGREGDSGPYQKATSGPAPRPGAVYIVAGSSGQIGGGTLNHPAMYLSLNQLGSLVLDISGNTLEAKFVSETGVVADYFTLIKDLNITSYSVVNGILTLTWNSVPGKSYWVERATNVGSPNWTVVSEIITASDVKTFWQLSVNANPPPAFYRIRVWD